MTFEIITLLIFFQKIRLVSRFVVYLSSTLGVLFNFQGALFHERYIMEMVDLGGLEPPTSRLSGVRSNLLSYKSITS